MRPTAKIAVFLVVAAVFMWPGYMSLMAVVALSDEGAPPLIATPPPPEPIVSTSFLAVPPSFVPTPTPRLTPRSTATPVPPLNLRHLSQKYFMLSLTNEEREKAGVPPVVLGDNRAAQLHAESSLLHCFSSHWGVDGLKPYMRYGLAGGYQSNGENALGSDYCIKASDGYRAIGSISQEVADAMRMWMGSPGHRDNILDPWHQAVNIGLAWDRHNFIAVQHFEGNYVEYEQLPSFDATGQLSLAGRAKNGAGFRTYAGLGVQIFYDPPPHSLTRGQISRTYCYDAGLPIASLREPLEDGRFYDEDQFTMEHEPCPDPYDVPADAAAPRSHDEANLFWQRAYNASQRNVVQLVTVPWITARQWRVSGTTFALRADLGHLLAKHGPGVYTVFLWGMLGGERTVISQYPIFHDIPRPKGYD